MAMIRAGFLLALCACASPSKRLVIPADMKRPPSGPQAASAAVPTATRTPGAPARTAFPSAGALAQPVHAAEGQRTVLRLTDHGRIWEIELPDEAGGVELRMPLAGAADTPTEADRQLLAASGKEVVPGTPGRSYLSGLAQIGDLYGSKKYELALIQAVELETQYPGEARVSAMKGSLYLKLGKPKLAREAWQKALELDPGDIVVAEALRGLKEE